jgi:hypothetical protein
MYTEYGWWVFVKCGSRSKNKYFWMVTEKGSFGWAAQEMRDESVREPPGEGTDG